MSKGPAMNDWTWLLEEAHTPDERGAIADLIAEAERLQLENEALEARTREELAKLHDESVTAAEVIDLRHEVARLWEALERIREDELCQCDARYIARQVLEGTVEGVDECAG